MLLLLSFLYYILGYVVAYCKNSCKTNVKASSTPKIYTPVYSGVYQETVTVVRAYRGTGLVVGANFPTSHRTAVLTVPPAVKIQRYTFEGLGIWPTLCAPTGRSSRSCWRATWSETRAQGCWHGASRTRSVSSSSSECLRVFGDRSQQ